MFLSFLSESFFVTEMDYEEVKKGTDLCGDHGNCRYLRLKLPAVCFPE
jgi:hypothetical protein